MEFGRQSQPARWVQVVSTTASGLQVVPGVSDQEGSDDTQHPPAAGTASWVGSGGI